jgi:hypothetical protein
LAVDNSTLQVTMNTPPTTPQKRQEKTQKVFTYASAVSKGQRMYEITLEDSYPPSIYLSQCDLIQWGWSRSIASQEYTSIYQADHRELIQACAMISGSTNKDICRPWGLPHGPVLFAPGSTACLLSRTFPLGLVRAPFST